MLSFLFPFIFVCCVCVCLCTYIFMNIWHTCVAVPIHKLANACRDQLVIKGLSPTLSIDWEQVSNCRRRLLLWLDYLASSLNDHLSTPPDKFTWEGTLNVRLSGLGCSTGVFIGEHLDYVNWSEFQLLCTIPSIGRGKVGWAQTCMTYFTDFWWHVTSSFKLPPLWWDICSVYVLTMMEYNRTVRHTKLFFF